MSVMGSCLYYLSQLALTFKTPRKAEEQMTIYLFFSYFSEKIMLDISCESSAQQTIHMLYQALFPVKNKKNKYFKNVVCQSSLVL